MTDALTVRTLTLPQIREVYARRMTEDFPADELKPLAAIERALARGQYVCYGFFSGEELVAYAYFAKLGNDALADYFAVEKSMRERGLGSQFIRALVDGPLNGMDCVLLEVDDPDRAPSADERALRQRRLRFYLANGLSDTGVRATVFHVPFTILAMPVGEIPAAWKVRRVYASIYRAMLPEDLYARMVRLDMPEA